MWNFHDKTIFVTGGTGSFGSHFIRTILTRCHSARLVVYSRDELKQSKLSKAIPSRRVRYVLGDVRDATRLCEAMAGADIVVHAAALKQVPAAEEHPSEAVETNVIGTMNVITAARANAVQKVIALSTDKAVEPINAYGGTKLVAEKLFTATHNDQSQQRSRFSVVRYGNVIGSRGSVVPLFIQQRKSGTIQITDPNMTRFWMTLSHAVHFVVQCLAIMKGGEIFVPKLPSACMQRLAQAIAPYCTHRIIGIRPGEKLHEILVSKSEAHRTVELDDMFIITPQTSTTSYQGDGKTLPPDFHYASNSPGTKMSVREIQNILEELGYEIPNSIQSSHNNRR